MEPLLADIHPDALQVTFLQFGASDKFKPGWIHEKTVPHNIMAQSLAGSYEIRCAGRSVRLKPMEAFLTPAYEPLRIVHHHDKRKRFSARWVHFSFSLYQTIDATSLLEMPLGLGKKTSILMGEIIEELSRPETPRTTLAAQLKNLARHRELTWSLLRHICALSKFKPDASDRLRAGQRLEPLLTYLKNHLSTAISVKEMADLIHMSPSAFYAFFQNRMRSSPMEFVKRMRLNEAAAQFSSTDHQLKEVAARTGFANPFHLSREFKRLFGLSPRNFPKPGFLPAAEPFLTCRGCPSQGNSAPCMTWLPAAPTAATDLPRLQVKAKFFFEGDTKFYLQGVTYGPFRPTTKDGPNLPTPEKVSIDFGLMRDLGVNVIRVYHTPPKWFLDLAQNFRMRVMVTIPWHKRVLFLDESEAVETIRTNVAKAAQANAGHPAMLGFFIDNEIPPDLVRWYGARRMEEFLNSLVRIVKKYDPQALAAYANFPPTEYLLPSEVDFYSYNVYLHRKKDLVNYLGRLQNLAGDKPLILSEFGMDTIRHPEEEQAALLAEHVTTVFEAGLAGTFIFSWTDEWFTDGVDVTDWAFGIVTTERRPKKSYQALQSMLKNPERPLYQRFKPENELPMVSIVVCSYNGARTLRDCMNSLRGLHYPSYEVIFIDDGSKDNTQEIMKDFPEVRNIVQVNKGLSVARNVGIAASRGEVVAFTDSDCMVDRDWVYFLVHSLLSGDFAAVGGPNISPPATDWIQATVGAAPGSPSHVLLTDTIAEHVPGCNMAYFKWALDEIGGFDPEYRKAGDDVDVCWRLMQRGYQIGFSPAAVVWHYRRFEVRTYFSQQTGYGEAEAMLRYKHLQYFGATGSAIWHGNVYSQVKMDSFFSKPVIYHGIFGMGLFQCIYPKRYSPFAGLLSSLEWLAVTLFVFFLSIPLPWLRLIPLIMFGSILMVGLGYMAQARIEAKFDSIPSRLLLLYLAIMQPWRRAWARYFTWLRGKRTPPAVIATKEDAPHLVVGWRDAGSLAFWSETGLERTHLLTKIEQLLDEEGWKFSLDTGWTNWDMHVFASRWWNLRLLTMSEIYPHGRRLTRCGNFLNISTFSSLVGGILLTFSLVTLASLITHTSSLTHPTTTPAMFRIALSVLGIDTFVAALWIIHGLRLRHRLAELVEVAAIRAGLQPLGKAKKGN